MTIETEDDVVALKRIGRIVSSVLHEMLAAAEPGMTTRELDALGAQLLARHGARSAPKLTYNFPGSTCISINATRMALQNAMQQARAGQPINGIGAAIERTAKTYGFKIIENLGSHGVGRALHEEPEHIAGYFDRTDTRILTEGMVITIEPFLSTKSRVVTETSDGWTLVGARGNLSAQYEHTMIITKGEPIVVTQH